MAKKKIKSSGAPGWMVTFGDMMSLLLTFFVLLFTFSTLDVVKFREVIISLQGAMGVLSGGPQILNMGDIPTRPQPTEDAAINPLLDVMQVHVQEVLEEADAQDVVDVQKTKKGLLIRFKDRALFDSGRAVIRTEMRPVLQELAKYLSGIENDIEIQGHTDNVPINTVQFPSNWELSQARAAAVLNLLLSVPPLEGEWDQGRFSIAGYGEYHPIESNDTPEGRQANRRVDAFILNQKRFGKVDEGTIYESEGDFEAVE